MASIQVLITGGPSVDVEGVVADAIIDILKEEGPEDFDETDVDSSYTIKERKLKGFKYW